ncbi:MAG: tetratricopeptide repeat protein [Candidatus Sulfotelmatobacter sp.]
MKLTAMMVAVLGIAVAQNPLAQGAQSNNKPAAQSTPAAGQTAGQAAPAGKRPPQAKTQPEFEAYKTAVALTDPAAQEKAADEFATKFPDSELKPLLYKSVMHEYQSANNGDKMMEMAQKLLTYDPDDPEALLAVAQVIAERTHDTDLDKDQKLAEARKDAQRALVTVDTDIPTAGQPPDRIEAYKNFLRSEAYEIIGTLDYNKQAWADAEGNLRKSIDAYPQQVDPVAVLRLSLALDQENKYPEALKFANQAVDLTKEGTVTGDAARKEKDRLTQLTGGTPPAK